jgi:hypothetical protein
MKNNDISISTTMFGHEHSSNGRDLIECLKMIKASGFTMAEISHKQVDIKQREAQIRATGVKILAIHGSLGGNAVSLNETERRAAVEVVEITNAAENDGMDQGRLKIKWVKKMALITIV